MIDPKPVSRRKIRRMLWPTATAFLIGHLMDINFQHGTRQHWLWYSLLGALYFGTLLMYLKEATYAK